ncbi:hypothetical protein PH7735_03964 [Shimia thalassica]|uniref:Uncharacterized protein n=1 Tax=Shimia thalassica TaxID=1715693 RepID=A0A0P1IIL8_9RHOB|nr:hypothetical protein PH7735_03964 [Shimia thalassica]
MDISFQSLHRSVSLAEAAYNRQSDGSAGPVSAQDFEDRLNGTYSERYSVDIRNQSDGDVVYGVHDTWTNEHFVVALVLPH